MTLPSPTPRRWGTVAAVTMLLLPVLAAPAAAAGSADPAAVARVVADFAGRAGYPGIVVAITQGDRVLYTGGHGHDSSGAAVTATTPMPIASLSKSFTALAVMQLAEQGRVELDAPVTRYVTDLRTADPRGARITVRHLLEQTSGITDRTLPEKSLPQPGDLAAAVRRVAAATLAAEPGSAYAYTNTNYHLAARLVEVVSGQPFDGYLADRVFAPLGMRSATSVDRTPRDLPGQVREGYRYLYGMTFPAAEPDRFVAGSDGVIASAADLAQWLIMQHGGGVAPGGARLLSTAGITATHTPSAPGRTYAMGWQRDADGRVRHNGVWFTYTASQLLLPSGYGIAVVGNSGIGLGNEGTDQLADALADLVTGGSPQPPAPVRLIADLVLAALTLLSVALGVRNLRRGGAWARRFAAAAPWRPALRLAPRLAPAVLLAALPDLLGLLVGGGRDLTYGQLTYYSLPLVLWTATAAGMNLAVAATRLAGLVRARRTTPPAPVQAEPQVAGYRR
ncbi:serine hydrolase [Catellatospora methionotrophica]|uniref:Serine hydrolase n=1 Tax=Catellatospora methionotrophica TaxID=121620 RepID=A0A8J3LB65_9ACTN|nr:serine hydrolase domain-containing protein [Catellatospora methionotrophica]GIG15149.1 serine hydrolase [Catellatospora methionotrophica]